MPETAQLLTSTNEHNTYFYWCNDVHTMRHFYSELIGLEETYYQDDRDRGWYSCLSENIQLVCVRAGINLPVKSTLDSAVVAASRNPAWVIRLPVERFGTSLRRLKEAGINAIQHTDELVFVLDPMGNTIELQAS